MDMSEVMGAPDPACSVVRLSAGSIIYSTISDACGDTILFLTGDCSTDGLSLGRGDNISSFAFCLLRCGVVDDSPVSTLLDKLGPLKLDGDFCFEIAGDDGSGFDDSNPARFCSIVKNDKKSAPAAVFPRCGLAFAAPDTFVATMF